MVIKNSNKPILIIGFTNSTLTQEIYEAFLDYTDEKDFGVITPDDFVALPSKKNYQYIIGFALELDLRKKIIDIIDTNDLNCISYIHDNCYISSNATIGQGVFMGPFSSVCKNAVIEDHVCIETYCLISHYSVIGTNTIIRSGTKIAGRTVIGRNCTLGFNSAVLNSLTVTDNVHLGAYSNLAKSADKPGNYVGSSARKIS